MTEINTTSLPCPSCGSVDTETFSWKGEPRGERYFVCERWICNACDHCWQTDWKEENDDAYAIEGQIQRDFDHEQETGLCSYCGDRLEVVEAPDGTLIFNSCAACNAYNDELLAEDWLNEYEGHYVASDFDQSGIQSDNLDDIPF